MQRTYVMFYVIYGWMEWNVMKIKMGVETELNDYFILIDGMSRNRMNISFYFYVWQQYIIKMERKKWSIKIISLL